MIQSYICFFIFKFYIAEILFKTWVLVIKRMQKNDELAVDSEVINNSELENTLNENNNQDSSSCSEDSVLSENNNQDSSGGGDSVLSENGGGDSV